MTMEEYSKRYCRFHIWIGICILVLAIVLGLYALTVPVSAAVYELHQGDTAYLGETADMSLVASWPDFTLAWCPPNYDECDSPKIYDVSSFMRKTYLDPSVWKVGNYFRWDGEWHRAENSFAFKIVDGVRPYNQTFEYLNNDTEIKEPTKPRVSEPTYPTTIVLARGDEISMDYHGSDKAKLYLWLFGVSPSLRADPVYGEAMLSQSSNLYRYTFYPSMTRNMEEGTYRGFIQTVGANGVADVFYRESHKVAEFETVPVFDTIYDDSVVPDVALNGLLPSIQYDRFNILKNDTRLSDDQFVPLTIFTVTPAISMTEYYETDDTLVISGTTSLAPGTKILVKSDPDNYALKEDIAKHTWNTTAVGSIDKLRTFTISIPINWDEISIGEHTILAYAETGGIHVEATKQWRATDTYVMPTPTPKRERVLVEEYGWHRINESVVKETTKAPIATFTPAITVTVVQNVTQTGTATPTVTVGQNATQPTRVPTQDPNIHVPVSPYLALLAIVSLMIISRRKS